jgi:hypothetical protein
MLQIVASLTDNSRFVIYDHIFFIVKATAVAWASTVKKITAVMYVKWIYYLVS